MTSPLEGAEPSPSQPIRFEDLCGPEPEDRLKPPLDRQMTEAQLNALSDDQRAWARDGVLHLPAFLPDELIVQYCKLREKLARPTGWTKPAPYLFFDQIKNIGIYSPLMEKMRELIGDHMGLHLSLTGWVSTERNWHQDDFLNPEFVNSHYAAVWMALDDIHPDSGPFQYVPGSHKWPLTRRELVRSYLSEEENQPMVWPKNAERVSNSAFEEKIEREGIPVVTYLPKKGDVLIWHGRLAHRGSEAIQKGMMRKALICHYSAVGARKDMPRRVWYERPKHNAAGHYFDFDLTAPNIALKESETPEALLGKPAATAAAAPAPAAEPNPMQGA